MFGNTGFRGMMDRAPVTMNLLIINCLMLLLTWLMSSSFHIDLYNLLGLFPPDSQHYSPYQYITSMFMHAGMTHLFFNMFALFMFGAVLEQQWGGKRFLFFYVFCGLGAAALNTLVNEIDVWRMQAAYSEIMQNFSTADFLAFVRDNASEAYYTRLAMNPALDSPTPQIINEAGEVMHRIIESHLNVPMVGASGAVYGILLGFGMMFPNAELYLFFIPIPVKAKYAVIGFAALELTMGLSMPGSNIAHFAHLGGMLFGLILILYWKRHASGPSL